MHGGARRAAQTEMCLWQRGGGSTAAVVSLARSRRSSTCLAGRSPWPHQPSNHPTYVYLQECAKRVRAMNEKGEEGDCTGQCEFTVRWRARSLCAARC